MTRLPVVLVATSLTLVASILAFLFVIFQDSPTAGLLLTCGITVAGSLGLTLAIVKAPLKTVPNVPDSEGNSILEYRSAVKAVWADGRLNEVERDYLGALEGELSLTSDKTDSIEREVLGGRIKEEIESDEHEIEQKIVYRGDAPAQYRTAVGIAWADEKLTKEEKELLRALESEFALSSEEVTGIEREIMGGSKEEIPTYVGPSPQGDEQWIKLVEECVEMVDELDRHMVALEPKGQQLADHVILRLGEGLERSGVEVISGDEALDRRRHKLESAGAQIAAGATITETLSPGFAVGRRVLRRARVRVE